MLVRFLVRLVIAAGVAAGVAWAVKLGLQEIWPPDDGKLQSLAVLGVTGLVDVAVYLALSRLLRIAEVTSVMSLVTGRLRR